VRGLFTAFLNAEILFCNFSYTLVTILGVVSTSIFELRLLLRNEVYTEYILICIVFLLL
jgi:hypothetical protein